MSGIDRNADVIFSDTFCSRGCASEETYNLKIKFESICEVFGADVKEEKVFESGQNLNHSVDDDLGTPPLENESELLKSGAQDFSSINIQQDVNEEECDASTSNISSPVLVVIGSKTPGG